MLRSANKVPGRALKMVPSLTLLSEHPRNMNGGAEGSSAAVPKTLNNYEGTLSFVSEFLQETGVRGFDILSELLVALEQQV